MPKPKESSAGEATLRVGDGGTDETKEKLAQELAESTTKKKTRASKSVKRSQNESPGKDKKRTKTKESGEHVGVATTQDNVDGTSEKALNQAKSADDQKDKGFYQTQE